MAKILILDDDIHLQELYLIILAKDKHEIKTLFNPDNILHTIDVFKPDVVLLDVKLHVADGRDVCREIKDYNKYIPILLISATNNYLKDLKGCEADDVITKPFEIKSLIDKINKLSNN